METADGGRDERHNLGEKLSGKERFLKDKKDKRHKQERSFYLLSLKDKKDKRHKQGKEDKERTAEGLQAR